jgi:hypothetical protein
MEVGPMKSRIDYTAASKILHRGPCALQSVTLAGDGADADAQIYDGFDTNGRLIAHIEVLSGQTAHIVYPEDIPLERGLYVVVSAATSKLSAVFAPLK